MVCLMCHEPFDENSLHKCPVTGETVAAASSPELAIEDDYSHEDTQEDKWMIAQMWFRTGDEWNEKQALPKPELKAWLREQRERWGAHYYGRMRREGAICGEVAARWPVHLRTPDHDWPFYRENSPPAEA